MCFVWISGQRAIISLHSIRRLVFITETERVYCAVRTGSLNRTQFNFRREMINKSYVNFPFHVHSQNFLLLY
jgi:hypothetical protein